MNSIVFSYSYKYVSLHPVTDTLRKSLAACMNTCNVSIVLLQLVGFHPLVTTLLVNMNFVVIWTDGNF